MIVHFRDTPLIGNVPVTAGAAREEAAPSNISLLHVHGDPLRFADLAEKVDVRRFACAIVLCDAAWADPDMNNANGIALRTKVGP